MVAASKRKVKYKRYTLMLSEKQKKIIDRYCELRKTSPNKLIKTAIKEYLQHHASALPQEEEISENQLCLFDEDEE
jgi:hypothetical protein